MTKEVFKTLQRAWWLLATYFKITWRRWTHVVLYYPETPLALVLVRASKLFVMFSLAFLSFLSIPLELVYQTPEVC